MFVSSVLLIRHHATCLLKYCESLTARFKRRQYSRLILLRIRQHVEALRGRRGIRALSHSALFGESVLGCVSYHGWFGKLEDLIAFRLSKWHDELAEL